MNLSLRAILIAVASSLVLFTASSSAEDGRLSRVGPASTIEAIRANAEVWDFVTLEGRVIKKTDGLYFELDDDTGTMTVRIPDYVTRELGKPKLNERIRVMGKFDHKTLYTEGDRDSKKGAQNWGVRVEKMQRNVSDTAETRNPDIAPSDPIRPIQASASPAALSETRFEAKPNAGQELVERMSAARKRVDVAQKALDDADVAYARALGRDEDNPNTLQALQQERRTAEADLHGAINAVSPLVEEAREAGVSEGTLQLYQRATKQ